MIGLILGKFFPLHRGHCFVIDMAIDMCAEVHICVCSKNDESIEGSVRVEWVRAQYPHANVTVHHITKEIEEAHANNPHAPKIWADELRAFIGNISIDYVFSSERYGKDFSKQLNAQWVVVDEKRSIISVSGEEIRKNIYHNWDYLASSVKPYFVKKVGLQGDKKHIIAFIENVGGLLCDPYFSMVQEYIADKTLSESQFIQSAKSVVRALSLQDYPLICCDFSSVDATNALVSKEMDLYDMHLTINNEDDVIQQVQWWMSVLDSSV